MGRSGLGAGCRVRSGNEHSRRWFVVWVAVAGLIAEGVIERKRA